MKMKIQKILTVTPQEKKNLQIAGEHISNLIYAGNELCSDISDCMDCPYYHKSYACPIDTFNSSPILNDLKDFINQLPITEEE